MNIYKLAVFVIMINLVFGVSGTLGHGVNTQQDVTKLVNSNVQNQIDDVNNKEATANSDDTTSVTTGLEVTVGSGIGWTRMLKNIFWNSLNPVGITPKQYTEGIGKGLAYLIIAFRSFLSIFLIIKVINVIKNKDTA